MQKLRCKLPFLNNCGATFWAMGQVYWVGMSIHLVGIFPPRQPVIYLPGNNTVVGFTVNVISRKHKFWNIVRHICILFLLQVQVVVMEVGSTQMVCHGNQMLALTVTVGYVSYFVYRDLLK